MSVGNSEQLLVNSLEAHKEVLQTKCYSFFKPAFFARLVGEIVGKGLLFSEGDEHKKQRRLLAGTYTLEGYRSFDLTHAYHRAFLVIQFENATPCFPSRSAKSIP